MKWQQSGSFARAVQLREHTFLPLPDSPWFVARGKQHGGKLMWYHPQTGETTWKQPLPAKRPLDPSSSYDISQALREQSCVAKVLFVGAPPDPVNASLRTGIAGAPPDERRLRRTSELLSLEHIMYPRWFLAAFGLKMIFFCEELHYNAQRRRDVPDLGSGHLYIDVGDRAARRKRHSFHHELWHMIDYHLRGNSFNDPDPEWTLANPPGFRYGIGGKHMRHDSASSQLASAPSVEFLNRYSTSSIAEDKAEVWAALMCYQQILKSDALCKKAELLKKRVRAICDDLDEVWWEGVCRRQSTRDDYWEVHQSETSPGRMFWFNFITGEKHWVRPGDDLTSGPGQSGSSSRYKESVHLSTSQHRSSSSSCKGPRHVNQSSLGSSSCNHSPATSSVAVCEV
mmetsp:Transcript_25485/g.42113  ORF Transcript_25485/g.42113 Transcript_25485/m.42113 type:complete len:398 (+) Transcript_25485:183-1376(+)